MKKRKIRNAGFSIGGAVIFFAVIAGLMQIAILVYDHIRERTDNVVQIAVLILILIIILSVVCTVFDYIRRKITIERPTKKILDATEKIASGDFSTNLNITHEYSKYDQYDLIMENVNKMTAELKKNEVLKLDFISNVSHEIKTPLSVIQNYATLIQDENLDAETRKKYAETLMQASRRITDLITNILKLNKLENQEILDKKEKFNLTGALAESIVEYESLFEEKNIELVCDFDEINVISSRSLLEVIWNNLISNAIKFSNDGGKITVSLKQLGKDAELRVTDTGIGMSAETGERIFEKFYQGDTSHASKGNGLGLALVKKVIDILGGEISVQSALGMGSTFTILLKGVVDEGNVE